MISEALGQAYLTPQRPQPQQVAPEAQAPQEPSPWQNPMAQPDQLAQVEGLTNNYYNAYGRLKDFTETMWKDYGLDVTKPDFTQQGGGNLHQAFQAMDADLRLAANDLSQHKKNTEMMNKLQAEGKIIYQPGYDPTKQLSTQLEPYQMYTPTDLSEDVKLAIQGVSNQVYNTPAEAKAAYSTLQPLINKYNDLITSDPKNKAYYERQINALRMPTYDTKTYNPYSRQGGTGDWLKDKNAIVQAGLKYVNLFRGSWDPGSYTMETINTPEGVQTVAVNKTVSALSLGTTQGLKDTGPGKAKQTVTLNKVIDKMYQLPDGRVYAKFKNPGIPDEEVSSLSPGEIVNSVYKNNPQVGDAEKFNTATASLKLENPAFGDIAHSSFYLNNPEGYQQVLQGKESTLKSIGQAAPKVNAEMNRIKALPESDIIQIGDFKFKKNLFGGKYMLEGNDNLAKEKLKQYGINPTNKNEWDNLDKNGIINLLQRVGYFNTLVGENQPTSNNAQTSTIPQAASEITTNQKSFLIKK